MELVGDEKRVRALFSDLSLADEQTTPSFAGVWNRAQSKASRRQRTINLRFVAAAALLVCALLSLAWWLRQGERNTNVFATAPHALATSPMKVVTENREVTLPKPLPKGENFGARSRALKLRRDALLSAANRRATRDAKTIAGWQSPTATLLASQSDELLKSLPQLNQTVDELNSFLPGQRK